MKPSLEIQPSRSDPGESLSATDKLHQLLLQLWITSKATVSERIDTIRFAQKRMDQGNLDDPTRKQAADAAHKLAGILGTFGIPAGSELARQIEVAMEAEDSPESMSAEDLAAILTQLTDLINQKSSEIPSA
jgi:HPt (histidine-containing phosphotransfer) domain-containing protein